MSSGHWQPHPSHRLGRWSTLPWPLAYLALAAGLPCFSSTPRIGTLRLGLVSDWLLLSASCHIPDMGVVMLHSLLPHDFPVDGPGG